MGGKGGKGGSFVERGTPLPQSERDKYVQASKAKQIAKNKANQHEGAGGENARGYEGGAVSGTTAAREGIAGVVGAAVGVMAGPVAGYEAWSATRDSLTDGVLGDLTGLSEFGEDKDAANAAAAHTGVNVSDAFGSLLGNDGEGGGGGGFGGFGGDTSSDGLGGMGADGAGDSGYA